MKHRSALVSSVNLNMSNGEIKVLRYDPPLDYENLEGAMQGKFFVFRLEYPSYRTLRYYPMIRINSIDVHFTGELEK